MSVKDQLFHACGGENYSANLAEVQQILASKPNLTNEQFEDHFGWTPLITATIFKQTEIMRFLLSLPIIDVNKQNFDGNTALHLAFTSSFLKGIELLLNNPKINVHLPNKMNQTVAENEKYGLIMNNPNLFDVLNKYENEDELRVPWCQSKFVLIGERGKGKSTLKESLMGLERQPHLSGGLQTIFDCEVTSAELCHGVLHPSSSSSRLLESALVFLTKNQSDLFHSQSLEEKEIQTKSSLQYLVNPSVDSNQLFKCLKDEPTLNIKLYDFCGEDTFEILHSLFFTSYGIYILVFDLQDFLNAETVDNCLLKLRKWISSIEVHMSAVSTPGENAKLVLVGTHADVVNQITDHQIIEQKLLDITQELLVNIPIIKRKQGEIESLFFPVSNNKSQTNNLMLQNLLDELTVTVSSFNHVNQFVSLKWLKVIDEIRRYYDAWIPLEKLMNILSAVRVPQHEHEKFLTFLQSTGQVIWVNEIKVRNYVVLDPIRFFVKAASVILYQIKRLPDKSHFQALKNHKHWTLIDDYGILSEELAYGLLQNDVLNRDHLEVVLLLLIKYGFIVPFSNYTETSGAQRQLYLAPSLIPTMKEVLNQTISFISVFPYAKILEAFQGDNTFYISFQCRSSRPFPDLVSLREICKAGIIPTGLFEKLVCKMITYCKNVPPTEMLLQSRLIILRDCVILTIGFKQFRLKYFPEYNILQIDVKGDELTSIYNNIHEKLTEIIEERFPSLEYSFFLSVSNLDCQDLMKNSSINSEEIQQLLFLRLSKFNDQLTAVVAPNHAHLKSKVSISSISNELFIPKTYEFYFINSQKGYYCKLRWDTIKKYFSPWIHNFFGLEKVSIIDIFFSYRQKPQFVTNFSQEIDQELVNLLTDNLSMFQIEGKEGKEDDFHQRKISIFYDKYSLHIGKNFREEIIESILHTKIYIPIISSYALERLRTHSAEMIDNLLLEWIVAIEYSDYLVEKKINPLTNEPFLIVPFLFGKYDTNSGNNNNNEILTDFQAILELNEISNTLIPERTYQEAEKILKCLKAEFFVQERVSIRMIVERLLAQNGISLAKLSLENSSTFLNSVVNSCRERILELL